MNAAWIIASAVLVIGAVAIFALIRLIAEAVDQMLVSARRFRRVEDAMIPLRVETRRARSSLDHFDRR